MKVGSKGFSLIEAVVLVSIMGVVLSLMATLIFNTQKSMARINYKVDQITAIEELSTRLKDAAVCTSIFGGTVLSDISLSNTSTATQEIDLQSKLLGGTPLLSVAFGSLMIANIELELIYSAPPAISHKVLVTFKGFNDQEIYPQIKHIPFIIHSQINGVNTITSCSSSNSGGGTLGFANLEGMKVGLRQLTGLLENSYNYFWVQAKVEGGVPWVRYRYFITQQFTNWEQTTYKDLGPAQAGHADNILFYVSPAGLHLRAPTNPSLCATARFQSFAPWGNNFETPKEFIITQALGYVDCSGGP